MENKITTKICTICKVEKPLEEYHASKIGKLKVKSSCKTCYKELYSNKEYNKKRSARRKEKRKDPEYRKRESEWQKEWNKKNIVKYLINIAKNRAKNMEIEFSLTEEDLILPTLCPLLGIEMAVNRGKKGMNGNSFSIDRKDSSKGYVKGNVWIISHRANMLKNNLTFEELEKIYTNWKKFLQ